MGLLLTCLETAWRVLQPAKLRRKAVPPRVRLMLGALADRVLPDAKTWLWVCQDPNANTWVDSNFKNVADGTNGVPGNGDSVIFSTDMIGGIQGTDKPSKYTGGALS